MALRHRLGVAIGIALLGAAFAACSSSSSVAPDGVKCTRGNYVFCRCADGTDGTKLCRADGASFDDCKCDGTGGPITPDPDGGLPSTPLEPVDAGPVTGPTIDATCTNKLGLVAGAATDNATFVSTYAGNGVFTTSKSASSPGVRGPVTILPSSGALVATYVARLGYLGWTKLSGTSWSAPASLGDGAADAEPTSMTLLAGDLRLFYLGLDAQFHMGAYSGANGWDITLTAGALAAPPGDAGAPIPGKSAPAAAAIGSAITLTFAGSDGTLARDTYATGSWTAVTKLTGAPAFGTPPAIASLDAGGTRDQIIVYPGQDLLLHVAVRDSSTKVWSAPILFDTAASSNEIALQALPGGKAMLVYKASNGQGYYAVWSAATGFGLPTELVTGKNPEIASVPGVARGQCGSDATIAYAQKDGLVKVLRFTASTMSGPYDVGGITNATYVGVGELP